MIDFIQVGNNITTLRKKMNLSQDQLAEKLYVTRQALSKWENGTSIPSINTLVTLSQIFQISFEKILGLDDDVKIEINESNIFEGYERNYILHKILKNEIEINIPDVFYQFSPSERLAVLKAIKDQKYVCDIRELWVKLTISEQKYLGGNLL